MGSIVPGVLLAISFIIVNYILARRYKLTMNAKKEEISIKQTLIKTLYTIPVLLLPFIILGGIYVGIFTPTESAAVGVIYTIILGLFYRQISIQALSTTLKDTVEISAMVGFLFVTAGIMGWILSSANIPNTIANNITPLIHSEVIFFIALLLFLLLAGMVMEPTASIVIFVPIILPIGMSFGVDPIHLGVVFCITLVIGFVTPPFGLNIFTAMSISKLPFEDVVRGIIPFLMIALVVLVIITFVPLLITWLPSML